MQIVVTPDGVELRRPDNFREFEALVSGDLSSSRMASSTFGFKKNGSGAL